MELKKYNAEVKLTKSNKIAECQKRFAQRVEKKEIPSLREWIAKQDKLYQEIQKKIEVNFFEHRNVRDFMRSISTQGTKHRLTRTYLLSSSDSVNFTRGHTP